MSSGNESDGNKPPVVPSRPVITEEVSVSRTTTDDIDDLVSSYQDGSEIATPRNDHKLPKLFSDTPDFDESDATEIEDEGPATPGAPAIPSRPSYYTTGSAVSVARGNPSASSGSSEAIPVVSKRSTGSFELPVIPSRSGLVSSTESLDQRATQVSPPVPTRPVESSNVVAPPPPLATRPVIIDSTTDLTPPIPERPVAEEKVVVPEVPSRPSLDQEALQNREESLAVPSRPNAELSAKEVTPPIPSRPSMKPKTSEKKEVTPEIPLRPSFEPTEKDATPEVPSRPSLEPDASKEKDATPEVPSRPSIGPEISDKKEVTPEISLRPSLEPEGSENKEVTSEVLSRPNVEPSEKEVTPPVPSRPNLQSVGSEEEEIPELPNQIEASEEIDSPVSDALTKTDSATETSIPTPQISTRPTIDGIPAETSTKTESESVEKSEEAEAKGILGASEEILSKSTREAAILERPVANEELAIPEKPVLDAKSATSESSITSTAPAPALPPVPRRLTDGSLSDASSETITKKPPPKVPKKPSSRIAAFQQMFAQQEAPAPVPRKIPPRPKPKSTESSGAESLEIFSADSPTSQPQITSRFTGAKADFAKNLNGMIGFGLPGMVPMPGMAMPVPTRADEADDTDQEKATVAKPNDVRKSRARGPKGRSLPKTVKVAVEDDSNKSRYEIFVSEVWRFETETEEQTNESTENPEKELEKENEKETGAEYVTIVTSKAAEEYAAEDIHEETTKTTQQEELVIPDKTEILPSSSSKPTEISAEVIPEAVPEVVTGADTENLVEASRAAIEDSDPVLASVADDQPQPDEAESEDLGEGVKPIEKTVDEPLEESEKTATRSEGESKDPVSPLDPTAEDPTVAEDNDQPN